MFSSECGLLGGKQEPQNRTNYIQLDSTDELLLGDFKSASKILINFFKSEPQLSKKTLSTICCTYTFYKCFSQSLLTRSTTYLILTLQKHKQMFLFSFLYHPFWLMMVKFKLVKFSWPTFHIPNNLESH